MGVGCGSRSVPVDARDTGGWGWGWGVGRQDLFDGSRTWWVCG